MTTIWKRNTVSFIYPSNSSAHIKYLQLVVSDEKIETVSSLFEQIYNFIEEAIVPEGFKHEEDVSDDTCSPTNI